MTQRLPDMGISLMLLAVSILVALVGLSIIVHTLAATSGRRLTFRGVASFFGALLWCLPAVAVIAYFGARVTHHFVQPPPIRSNAVVASNPHAVPSVADADWRRPSRARRAAERRTRDAFRRNQQRRQANPTSAETNGSTGGGDSVAGLTKAMQAIMATEQSVLPVSAEAELPNAPTDPETTSEAAVTVPAWFQQRSTTEANPNSAIVSSREYVAREEAFNEAVNLSLGEIKDRFHRLYPPSGEWSVPLEMARARVITAEYIESRKHDFGAAISDMYRVHLLLDVSPTTLDQFYAPWREQIVDRRLWNLGGLLGMVTVMLGTVAGYFRLDAYTQGRCRGRLKLAATLLIAATSTIALMAS